MATHAQPLSPAPSMVHRWRTSLMAIGPDRYEVTWCVDHGEVQSTVIFVGNPVLAGYR